MTNKTCADGNLGPVLVWSKESEVFSCSPDKGCETQEVCLDGVSKKGDKYVSSAFEMESEIPLKTVLSQPFSESPYIPTQLFSQNFTVYTLNSFIRFLDLAKTFPTPVSEALLQKPFKVYIGDIGGTPNAMFIPEAYALAFCYLPPLCSLGADADVIIHEFSHLMIFTQNRDLGFTPDDLEGAAVHESMSDAIAAIYNYDPVVGQSSMKCFDPNARLSKDIGLRRVDDKQGILFPDPEMHGRASLYSPFFWTTFKALEAKLFSKTLDHNMATNTAKMLMISIMINAPKFMPVPLTRRDVIRAMMLSAWELDNRIGFCKGTGIPMRELQDLFVQRGKARGLLKEEDLAWLAVKPGLVSDAEKSAVIKGLASGATTFKRSITKLGIETYSQYYNGIPVVGGSINFIHTKTGTIKIDNFKSVGQINTKIVRTKEDAIKAIELLLPKDLKAMLEASYGGNMSAADINITLAMAAKNDWKKGLKPELGIVPGKSNPQYVIRAKHVTYYVDSVDGKVSISRSSY